MSLPPKIRCILTPVPLAASLSLSINGNNVLATATQNLTPTSMPKRTSNTSQKHLCLHMSKPLVAYLLEDSTSQSAQALVSRRFVVQNIATREILDTLTMAELSYLIYRETDINKIPQAVQSLGTIQSLDFYDPSTLYWSGMLVPSVSGEGGHPRFETIIIQTTSRILIWNFRQGPNSHSVLYPSRKASLYKRLGAIIHETALGGNGAVPSSNLLPLSATTVLVGCSDGSLKSYDWQQKAVLKSIKGLGKGDWIVRLLAANRYTINEGGSNRRRILTITKKGICYLIELEITREGLDIKPPLARFVGGLAEPPPDRSVQHTTISFDPHRDLIFWLACAPKSKQMSMLVWNLKSLEADLVQQVGSKNLFKPDPTLTLHIPPFVTLMSSGSLLTTVCPVMHGAFAEDTVLVAVALNNDIHILGANFHPHNATNQVTAYAVMSSDLGTLIQNDGSLDFTPTLKTNGVLQAPLMAGSETSLLVATSLGLVFLELPVSSSTVAAARHVHFGAGLGRLGKSILYVQDNAVVYGSLDVLVANPAGRMEAKNPCVLYESPLPHNLPQEIQKRPFRSAPFFFPSPSGLFVCLFWPTEFRYEVLHNPSLLQRVGQRSGKGNHRTSVVISGHGVLGFAWVGDDDIFALLYAKDLAELRTTFMMTPVMMEQASSEDGVRSVASFAQSRKSSTLASSATSKAANLANTAATLVTTKSATKTAVKNTTKSVKKSLGGFFVKKKKRDEAGLAQDNTDDMSDGTDAQDNPLPIPMAPIPVDMSGFRAGGQGPKSRYIELRKLDLTELKSSELSASIAAASSTTLGEVQLRGGNRNLPTSVFGGPVLCVGSRTEEDPEGSAHFYTKKSEGESKAETYVSTGPTLPYPDIVVWDDDGSLCAVVVENRIAIYTLTVPDFTLMGTVRISNPLESSARVTSAKFVHGVLYCCTFSSVHCVFIGRLDGVARLDTYELASITAFTGSPITSAQAYKGLLPPSVPLPLVNPYVLGYQSGSLILSSARGLHAVPLQHPLLRIGTLLAAGQTEVAIKWFDAVPTHDSDALAAFVERRGYPEIASNISGISIERIVDMSMRHGDVGRLEEVVETYGVRGLRAIDAGRGVSPSMFGEYGGSVVVCVAAYLLAHGRVEIARRMATECLRSGDEGRRDALLIASLLLSVDEQDASRLVNRAVEDDAMMEWPVAHYIRNHALHDRTT